ncbi:MAG: HD domain-containing protein [Chloroflexota bacterium]|nr:HD domain-containing protein [Chloroflexota bacterium]
MTEAERAIAALHLRARVALAIAVLVFVGIAYQADLAGPDVPSRAFAVGVALALAAAIEELASRRARRQLAATAGTVAEFFAFALAVALFTKYSAFAPAVLLVPILLGAFTVRRAYLLYLAAMGMAIIVEVGVLRPGAGLEEVIGGLAWGVLYLAAAALAGGLGAQYRGFQRRTESAYASIATITAATSHSELARILFAYSERALDLPEDTPAVLLFDDRGIGTFTAIEATAIDPEQRARFRMSGGEIDPLRVSAGTGAFIPSAAIPASANPPEALRTGHPFLLPLRDARRLVGFAVFASTRRRRLTSERREDLARVADQVATTAVRIRGGRAIEEQRQVLASVLEAHSAERAEMQIATWLARSARDIATAHDVVVLQDLPDGRCHALYAIGIGALEVERGCGPLIEEVRHRGVAVVVTDGARERRIQLPQFLKTGATALIPVRGQGTYLFVHEPQREGLTSGILQLLVELCDHAATLLANTYAVPAKPGAPPAIERRLAAVVAHTRSAARPDESDSRARIVDAFRLAVEGNQPLLAGSGERVAGIAAAIAQQLDVDSGALDDIYVAALLRDVGELGIDRKVLETPGELSEDQREIVRSHPVLGETILLALAFLGDAARIVRAHHERWDGTGYPDELAGPQIPLGARILSVADAFVAMTSERPYRAPLRPAEAMGLLIAARGRAFDPIVIDAFVASNASGELGVTGVSAR